VTATDGSVGRVRGAARRLLGRADPGMAAEQAAAIDDVRTEVTALREDLVAFGAASDRTGDRIEALSRRVDELTRQVASLAGDRPAGPDAAPGGSAGA
jgi:phage shock protein A